MFKKSFIVFTLLLFVVFSGVSIYSKLPKTSECSYSSDVNQTTFKSIDCGPYKVRITNRKGKKFLVYKFETLAETVRFYENNVSGGNGLYGFIEDSQGRIVEP